MIRLGLCGVRFGILKMMDRLVPEPPVDLEDLEVDLDDRLYGKLGFPAQPVTGA